LAALGRAAAPVGAPAAVPRSLQYFCQPAARAQGALVAKLAKLFPTNDSFRWCPRLGDCP